jgi:ribonuclease P protein component
MTVRRLKTRVQFQAVLAGAPVAKTPHFALHRAALTSAPGAVSLFAQDAPSVGVLVPKRWAKRAVTRNTMRRQIYAVASDLHSQLPHAAWVVRLRTAFSREQYPSATSDPLKKAIRAELQALWQRAIAREPARV